MNEWKKRSKEILDHHYSLIIFDDQDDEGIKTEEMDIFRYDGIKGVFISKHRNYEIKYKEIKFWIPLPKKP